MAESVCRSRGVWKSFYSTSGMSIVFSQLLCNSSAQIFIWAEMRGLLKTYCPWTVPTGRGCWGGGFCRSCKIKRCTWCSGSHRHSSRSYERVEGTFSQNSGLLPFYSCFCCEGTMLTMVGKRHLVWLCKWCFCNICVCWMHQTALEEERYDDATLLRDSAGAGLVSQLDHLSYLILKWNLTLTTI